MANVKIIDTFESNGFTYAQKFFKEKEVFTAVPTDGSLAPRTITAKEYKSIKQAEILSKNIAEISSVPQATASRKLIPASSLNEPHSNADKQNPASWQAHIEQLCLELEIQADYHQHGQTWGRAWEEGRVILTPLPVDVRTFCIGLHEIGHFRLNAWYHAMPKIQAEYMCEMWAIRAALDYGCNTEDMLWYRDDARWYIRDILIQQSRLKSYKPEKVAPEIVMFTEIDPKRLVGATVIHERDSYGLIIHQPQDCKEGYIATEQTENPNLVRKKCLACGRQWLAGR